MAEHIACRSCESPDCKGCNLKRLETMLKNGKFDFLMNENLAISTSADVAPVVHGRWIRPHWKNSNYCCDCSECGGEAMHRDYQWHKNGIYPICPNCGAKMDVSE